VLTRTRTETVTFKHPFQIAGVAEDQPAGDYIVETNEELITGVSFIAYRRVNVMMHLRARKSRPDLTETVWLEPDEFDSVRDRDSSAEFC
jgi:hypothetical protein